MRGNENITYSNSLSTSNAGTMGGVPCEQQIGASHVSTIRGDLNSESASHDNCCTGTLSNRTITVHSGRGWGM